MRPADGLIRLVLTPDGELEPGRNQPGRGAWLCGDSAACLDLADRRQAAGRAFKGHVRPGAIERLRAKLAERARIEGRADDESA